MLDDLRESVSGFAGRYLDAKNPNRVTAREAAKDAELKRRRTAMALDALQGSQLLRAGETGQVAQLLGDRLKYLQDNGIDSSDTEQAMMLLQQGDLDGLQNAFDTVVNTGAAAGLLELPAAGGGEWKPMTPKVDAAAGTVTIETAPQQFESVPIKGYTPPPPEPAFDAEAQRKYLTDARKNITSLRAGMRDTEVAFGNLENAYKQGNKVGDMALVIQLMKTLDPSSVVREGEQVQVQKTASITDQAWNLYTSLTGEGSLTPEQRREILGIGREFYQGQKMATDRAVFEQLQYAEADGFNIEQVLGKGATERWQARVYQTKLPNGETINFSLYDILDKAQRTGKRPADYMREKGITLN